MQKLNSYGYPITITSDASGDGSGFIEKVFSDGYLYNVSATGAGYTGTGTLLVKTEAKLGKPQTTLLTDNVTTTTGIDIDVYNLVQDAAGDDISGEYNQIFIRRGERLEVVGDNFADGTLYARLVFADYPLPVTR